MSTQEEKEKNKKIEEIKAINEDQIKLILRSRGLLRSKKQVEFIQRFVNEIGSNDSIVINDKVCLPLYGYSGKYYLYGSDAFDYQITLHQRLENLIKHNVFSIEIAKNPQSHRMKKYLCLNLS